MVKLIWFCKKTEKILKIHPDDKVTLVSRASALRSVMNETAANEELDRLIAKFPDEPVIHRIKADLLGDKSTLEALPYYEKALAISIQKGTPDPAIQWNMSLHLLRARDLKGMGMLGTRVPSHCGYDGTQFTKTNNRYG